MLIYTGVAIVDSLHEQLKEKLTPLNLQWAYHEVDPDIFGEELDTEIYADADWIAAVVLTVIN